MDWLVVGALIHAFFVIGLTAVAVMRYLISPRRWHIVGMGVSYVILTLNNVYSVSVGFYAPGSLRFNTSLLAWVVGDVYLLLLLGRARSALDKYRKHWKP